MDFKQLDRGELVAVIGGAVLALSVFLAWYSLGNQFAAVGSCGPHDPHSSCTAWNALPVLRYVVLLASVAPVILAYIIIRGHALSWPRGELTAVIALAALTLIIFLGVIDKPTGANAPPGEISLDYGWFVALLGGLLILIGSLTRARESATRRKPPGVL